MSKQSDKEDELDSEALESMSYGIIGTIIVSIFYFAFFFKPSMFWVIFMPLPINLLVVVIVGTIKHCRERRKVR